MKTPYAIALSALLTLAAACGGSNSGSKSELTDVEGDDRYVNSPVNPVEQALPQIMVLPSDGLMKANQSLTYEDGRISRDYNKYLLTDKNARPLVSVIQNEFVAKGYPLVDLEQTLKQLTTRSATDIADNLARDAKTELLMTAAPDIIVEMDYKRQINPRSYRQSAQYTLSFIDAYTGKVFCTKTFAEAEADNAPAALQADMNQQMPFISKEIKDYFADIRTRGREITVRITVANGSPINLADDNIEGDTYSDWIRDYMNTHTVKGAYKMTVNTRFEMAFANVRIHTHNADGTQFNGYDWGREFAAAIRKQLGVKAENRSQGLADVHLVIL